MIIVVFGPPAGGKGTQATRLAERFGYPHISTGDILRHEQQQGTELGRQVTPIMAAGDLVPDSIITRLTDMRLGLPDAAQGAVLDGVPRTAAQAEDLDAILAHRGAQVDLVLTLDVPEDILRERARHRGEIDHRIDDRASAFAHRLDKYAIARASLIEHYVQQGTRTEEIDGTGSIDDVADRIAGLFAGVQLAPGG
ncbi:MAG: adenylate kinase [Candidatus Dormibacteria bacterium]